ncbi:endoglucanase-like protein [Sporocytophaga myxococcoides]|uniref:endo-1,4-beta-xylanase n=1 Tax=Sporocytophaga myxococcoides TaxID=153721 RepID=A0A098LD78_9BACT|nr:endo-1,4-beta-xylanase [Sporocytophaga myxococcoides]GAL84876.1 endoglucanase-like protein [Sporocytophaga myxococcoides]
MNKSKIIFNLIGIIILFVAYNSFAQTYPPSAVITMPFSNAYFKTGTDVEIHVYATDIGKTTNNGTVTKVEFFNGTTKLGETSTHSNNTYRFVWGCVPAGEYRITAKATNNKGVSFTSVGVLITVGNANFPSQGLAACKGKYMAGLHQNQLLGSWNSYFNGISAENACKWGSVEGNRDVMNWNGADAAYKAANDRKIMFRWHAAMWAAQYPNWLFTLSTADARAELIEYMEGIAARYKYIDQIDVLNEQLFTHQQANQQMRDKFSGKTNTAVDDFSWQIWLFTEARRIFPNTKLVLNDYGLEGSNSAIDEMLKLVAALRDRGIIDGFGTQAHWFSVDRQPAGRITQDCSRMARGGVPVYVTELDMAGGNDNNNNEQQQLASFQTHFPEFWEHPHVKGITWWGHVLNRTWVTGTGFTLENGQDRAAGAWLKTYMNSRPKVGYPMCPAEGCSNDGKISLAITAPTEGQIFTTADQITLSATAIDGDGTIANVKFYSGSTLLNTDNSAPYSFIWTGAPAGTHEIKVVATDNQGNIAEAKVTIKVNVPQGPYNGTWHVIPGTIQLEHFDVGGNGFAYMDATPGSEVTPVVNFRTDEDVDIENCTDVGAGYNIGWTTAGEWLEYSVDVKTPGAYDLDLRIAANGDGRTVTVAMDGVNIASNIAIPNTVGWQTWQTVKVKDVNLTAGKKIMRVTIGATDYVNMNYVTFTLTKELKQEPFKGSAHLIPGRIEAEEYDLGGEGLAYHEANANGNEGKATFRNDEVDIETTQDSDGAYNVGYILQGEWLEYTVNVAASGKYDLDVRIAAEGENKSFHIEMDGVNVTGPINIPNTGGWQTWQTVTLNDINLTGGEHIMRIAFDSDYMNLNYVEFKDVITGIAEEEFSSIAVFPNPFTASGIQINNAGEFQYKITDISGILVESGNGRRGHNVGKNLSEGIYFLIVENNNNVSVHKIVKQ